MYPLQHPKNLDSDNSKIFIHDKPLYYNTEMTGNEYISILKSCTFRKAPSRLHLKFRF